MGGKPRQKPMTLDEAKEHIRELGGRLVQCLKFAKFPTGMVYDIKTGDCQRLEEACFDSLDKIGFVVDRDEYYAQRRSKR